MTHRQVETEKWEVLSCQTKAQSEVNVMLFTGCVRLHLFKCTSLCYFITWDSFMFFKTFGISVGLTWCITTLHVQRCLLNKAEVINGEKQRVNKKVCAVLYTYCNASPCALINPFNYSVIAATKVFIRV